MLENKELEAFIDATNAITEAVSLFYKNLIENDIPEEVSGSLTISYMKTLMGVK